MAENADGLLASSGQFPVQEVEVVVEVPAAEGGLRVCMCVDVSMSVTGNQQ